MTNEMNKEFCCPDFAVTSDDPSVEVVTLLYAGNRVCVMGDDLDTVTPDRLDMIVRQAGLEFLRAVFVDKDLNKFQALYRLLRHLGHCPEAKEWELPLVFGVDRPTTVQLCLAHGSAEICEQNFRFSVFNEGHPLRLNSGSPIKQISGVARCMQMAANANAMEEVDFYTVLLERYLATFYGVLFNQAAFLLDPRGILATLKAQDSWETMSDFVLRYQTHYEAEWRAGKAPSVPLLEDEILDITNSNQVTLIN